MLRSVSTTFAVIVTKRSSRWTSTVDTLVLMKNITTNLAVALLAFNGLLIGTFAYSVATKTPDVQPWPAVAAMVQNVGEVFTAE
jgi:hypothetical protein